MSQYPLDYYACGYYRYSYTHGECAMRLKMLTSCCKCWTSWRLIYPVYIGRLSLEKCVNRFSLFDPCNLWIIEEEGTNNLSTPHLCTLVCRKRGERRILYYLIPHLYTLPCYKRGERRTYYYISTVLVIFKQAIKVQIPLITWAEAIVHTLALHNLMLYTQDHSKPIPLQPSILPPSLFNSPVWRREEDALSLCSFLSLRFPLSLFPYRSFFYYNLIFSMHVRNSPFQIQCPYNLPRGEKQPRARQINPCPDNSSKRSLILDLSNLPVIFSKSGA